MKTIELYELHLIMSFKASCLKYKKCIKYKIFTNFSN